MAARQTARWGLIVPNTLTVLRLGVAVAFPLAALDWRLPLVVVGAVSDALDGLAARALHASSWIGALLDGVADKVFTLSVLLTVTFDGPVTGAQLAGLLARDVVITLIAAWVGARGRWHLFTRVAARPSGKLTTFALFGMLVVLLWRPELGEPLVWVAIAASVGAALDYTMVFVRWSVWKVEPAHLPSDSESR